jgi:hypothetical protein
MDRPASAMVRMRDYARGRISGLRELRRPSDFPCGRASVRSVAMTNLFRSTAGLRGAVVLLAIAATFVLWAVESALLGVDLMARPVPGAPAQVVGPPAIVIATMVAGLLAWALLAILEHVTTSARTIWTVVAVVALLVSLLGPLGGGVSPSAVIGLVCMHVTAAAILIPLLPRSVASA